MCRRASPMAFPPEAQALVGVKFTPLAPRWMAICPGARLAITFEMKNGDTFRSRLSRKRRWNCSMLEIPPIPTPMITTRRRTPFCTSFPTKRSMLGRPPEGVKVTGRTRNHATTPWHLSWLLLGVLATGALVYVNTLSHQFVWDDLIALDQRV